MPPPGGRPAWPGAITVTVPEAPTFGTRGGAVVVCDTAAETIQWDDYRRQIGEDTDAMRSHYNLTREKVAVLLSVPVALGLTIAVTV